MQRTAGAKLHDVSTTTNSVPEQDRRWTVYRFYLSMLAIAAIDFCFAIIYQIPLTRFFPTAVLLVGLTLTGAYFIFRPVQRFTLNPESEPVPYRNIALLSYRCTALIALLIGLLAVVKFLFLPGILGFDIDSLLTRNEQLWLPVLHTLYYTALIFLSWSTTRRYFGCASISGSASWCRRPTDDCSIACWWRSRPLRSCPSVSLCCTQSSTTW